MASVPEQIVRRGGISRTVFVISLVVVAVAAGLGGYFTNAFLNPGTPTLQLSGSGSSLVYPLLSQWTSNYHGLHSNVQINYQSVGSGAGVTDFQNKVVDFAGTDAAPVPSTNPNVTLTIPETIGAITLAYNIQNVPTGLHLNENVTAEIFNGTITQWNDPAIMALNNGLNLPSNTITTVHRSDSSGTTFIFEGYLLKSAFWFAPQSKSWPSKAGGNSVTGLYNTGVANQVSNTPNSIGYVEVAYALQNSMNVAYVQNKARSSFVKPTLANITAAVSSADPSTLPTGGLQDWSTVSLLLEPGANSYPIVGFTYIIVYQQLNVRPLMTLDKAKALVDFLWYIVHDGQAAGTSLDYATLPGSIITIDETSIKSITYNGQNLPT
jgi:phosphate transport system substrate-binding protein